MRIAQSTPWVLLDENFLNLERVEAPFLLNLQNHSIGRPEEAVFSLIFVFFLPVLYVCSGSFC